jgi:hypothetical protein
MRNFPRLMLAGAAIALAVVACGEQVTSPVPDVLTPAFTHVDPVFVAGNPSCPAGFIEFKIEPVASGDYTDGVLQVSITVNNTSAGETFDWESNFGIDHVIVKGGPNANLYSYNPEETEDDGLHAPAGPSGKWAGLSHISFCYDIELEVEKTAETSFTRTYLWEIDKTAVEVDKVDELVYEIFYEVTVSQASPAYEDSDWAVAGEISIHNPHPSLAATITDVSDVISLLGETDIDAVVDCGADFPINLAAGGDLTCEYSADLPDGQDRLNTATVTTSGSIGGDEATADVIFGDPTTELDKCVDVYDDAGTPGDTSDDVFLGTVCIPGEAGAGEFEAPHTFEFSTTHEFDEAVCDTEVEITNVATAIGQDTETEITADETVFFVVQCDVPGDGEGCTPGYWRQEQHYDSWVGYDPSDIFSVVFGVGPSITLGEAVQLGGGGENALIRHAVAALLNSTALDDYPYTTAEVIAMVQAAYASGDFEETKDALEAANELGCPLN